MDKVKNFFKKNYDYYIITSLIILSFLLSLLDFFSNRLIKNIPCFLYEQKNFIKWASFEIDDQLPNIAKFFGTNGILIELIFKNIIGILLILVLYFIFKKLFLSHDNWLKIVATIFLIVFTLVLLYATIIMPIVGCLIKIG